MSIDENNFRKQLLLLRDALMQYNTFESTKRYRIDGDDLGCSYLCFEINQIVYHMEIDENWAKNYSVPDIMKWANNIWNQIPPTLL
jgi:hypothetical protein